MSNNFQWHMYWSKWYKLYPSIQYYWDEWDDHRVRTTVFCFGPFQSKWYSKYERTKLMRTKKELKEMRKYLSDSLNARH